jgi:hypothetical protein
MQTASSAPRSASPDFDGGSKPETSHEGGKVTRAEAGVGVDYLGRGYLKKREGSTKKFRDGNLS